MSNTPKTSIAIGVDPFTGHPIAAEIADTRAWPSERATHQAIRTFVEIHNMGYTGVRLAYGALSEGKTLLIRDVDLASPEGQLVNFLFGLAEYGYECPTDQAIGILRQIYRSAGLPTPTPSKDKIFISGMEE